MKVWIVWNAEKTSGVVTTDEKFVNLIKTSYNYALEQIALEFEDTEVFTVDEVNLSGYLQS